jgi:hypothetical protein
MADIIDRANNKAQDDLERCISAARSAGTSSIHPIGICHNYLDPLPTGQLFCNCDCRDDWQLRNPGK